MKPSLPLPVPYTQISRVSGLIEFLEDLKRNGVTLFLRVTSPSGMVHIKEPSKQLSFHKDRQDCVIYIDTNSNWSYHIGSLCLFHITGEQRAWDPLWVPPAYLPDDPELNAYPLTQGFKGAELNDVFEFTVDANYYGGEVFRKGTMLYFAGYRTQSSLTGFRYERHPYARFPDGTFRSLFISSVRRVCAESNVAAQTLVG